MARSLSDVEAYALAQLAVSGGLGNGNDLAQYLRSSLPANAPGSAAAETAAALKEAQADPQDPHKVQTLAWHLGGIKQSKNLRRAVKSIVGGRKEVTTLGLALRMARILADQDSSDELEKTVLRRVGSRPELNSSIKALRSGSKDPSALIPLTKELRKDVQDPRFRAAVRRNWEYSPGWSEARGVRPPGPIIRPPRPPKRKSNLWQKLTESNTQGDE